LVGTSDFYKPRELLEALWGVRPEMLSDFQRRNEQPILLSAFALPPPMTVMPQAVADSFELVAREREDPFKWFYEEYPTAGAVFRVTRPGISSDGTRALLELGWLRGNLDGQGMLLLLSCQAGRWQLEDSLGTWVS